MDTINKIMLAFVMSLTNSAVLVQAAAYDDDIELRTGTLDFWRDRAMGAVFHPRCLVQARYFPSDGALSICSHRYGEFKGVVFEDAFDDEYEPETYADLCPSGDICTEWFCGIEAEGLAKKLLQAKYSGIESWVLQGPGRFKDRLKYLNKRMSEFKNQDHAQLLPGELEHLPNFAASVEKMIIENRFLLRGLSGILCDAASVSEERERLSFGHVHSWLSCTDYLMQIPDHLIVQRKNKSYLTWLQNGCYRDDKGKDIRDNILSFNGRLALIQNEICRVEALSKDHPQDGEYNAVQQQHLKKFRLDVAGIKANRDSVPRISPATPEEIQHSHTRKSWSKRCVHGIIAGATGLVVFNKFRQK